MKAVPILVITNALALALALFLYVKQGELESRLGSSRSGGTRVDTAGTAALELRLEEIERRFAAPAADPGSGPIAAGPQARAGSRGEPAPPEAGLAAPQPPEGGDGSGPAPEAGAGSQEFDPREMESFRRKVRKANELNADEDQVRRVGERLDELVRENRIAPLTQQQREGVARTYMAFRQKVPEVWRKLRDSGALDTASREDRGRLFRTEFESMRVDAQRTLEDLGVPAADAKTIADEALRDRGMVQAFGGGPGGPGGPMGPQGGFPGR